MAAGAALPDSVRHAMAAIGHGDLTAARSVLRDALVGAALDAERPDPDVLDAARAYAGVLAMLGEPAVAMPYSTYGHHVAQTFDEPTADRCLDADLIHAYVLRVTGERTRAVTLWRDLARRLVIRFEPTGRPALAGHVDLAIALHESGECLTARQVLHGTYETYRHAYATDRLAVRMLVRIGVMARDCGDERIAREWLDAAQRECADRYPADAALRDVVHAAARPVGGAVHACGRPRFGRPAGVTDVFLGWFERSPLGWIDGWSPRWFDGWRTQPAALLDAVPVESGSDGDMDTLIGPAPAVPRWEIMAAASESVVEAPERHDRLRWTIREAGAVATPPSHEAAPPVPQTEDRASTVATTESAPPGRPEASPQATFGRMRRRGGRAEPSRIDDRGPSGEA